MASSRRPLPALPSARPLSSVSSEDTSLQSTSVQSASSAPLDSDQQSFGLTGGLCGVDAVSGTFVETSFLCSLLRRFREKKPNINFPFTMTVIRDSRFATSKVGAKGFTKRRLFSLKVNRITKGDIRRLARRGGVKRISSMVYEETQAVLKSFLRNVLHDATTLTDHCRRKTVTVSDVVYSLKRQGRTLYPCFEQ